MLEKRHLSTGDVHFFDDVKCFGCLLRFVQQYQNFAAHHSTLHLKGTYWMINNMGPGCYNVQS